MIIPLTNMNIKSYYWYSGSILIGLFLSTCFYYMGIMHGLDAVNYYAEVHKSQWNSNIHTLFMPSSCYGILIAVPAIFKMTKKNANILQEFVYYFYISHYLTISLKIGVTFGCIYYFVQECAKRYYMNNNKTIVKGLLISTTSLVIQEVIGHSYGGDEPSRLEGVFNAILYANYYAVSNLFRLANLH